MHEERIEPPCLEDILDEDPYKLELIKFRLEDERDSITHQIEIDAANKDEDRESIDLVWVAKARHAIRCRVTRIQQINRILKIREWGGEN